MKLKEWLTTISTEVEIDLYWDNLDFINSYYSKVAIRPEWRNHQVTYVCIMGQNKIAIYIK